MGVAGFMLVSSLLLSLQGSWPIMAAMHVHVYTYTNVCVCVHINMGVHVKYECV